MTENLKEKMEKLRSEAEKKAKEWGRLEELPIILHHVEPFIKNDLDENSQLLPKRMMNILKRDSRLMNAPVDFMAIPLVIALSTLAGARVKVQPKKVDTNWQTSLNLSGGIVNPPGRKKTPASSKVLSYLNILQLEEDKEHEALMMDYEVGKKVLEAKRAANEKKMREAAAKPVISESDLLSLAKANAEELAIPKKRRYWVNDITMEKLGEILSEGPNSWGMLIQQDELYAILASFKKQGHEAARPFYLTGMDGNKGYTFDRIQRGTTTIERLAFGIFGCTVPSKLLPFVLQALQGSSEDDGFIQRLQLLVYPDKIGRFEYIDEPPPLDGEAYMQQVFYNFRNLLPIDDKPRILRFEPIEAQQLFVEWYCEFMNRLDNIQEETHDSVLSHLSKFDRTVPILAAIIELIENIDATEISKPSLLRALAWQEYLESHMTRIYGLAGKGPMATAKTLLAKIKLHAIGNEFTVRDLSRKNWVGLTKASIIKAGCEVLEDHGYLRKKTEPYQVAPNVGELERTIYEVNPMIFEDE